MFLTKSRIPIVATILILLLGLVLILGQASADNASGPIPAGFGDDAGAELGWAWKSDGLDVRIDFVLGAELSGQVFSIEVFIEPTTGTVPAFTAQLGPSTPFPTGRPLSFSFQTTPPQQLTPTSNVGLHLMGQNAVRIRTSDGPANQASLTPTPTPTPPPAPTPTAVVTTEVPTAQVTPATVPTGGVGTIIQPSLAATLSAADGSIAVAVPVAAYATTFQLVYNPSPASVPAAPAGTTILRAFELNAHDTAGTKVSLSLLKPVTITVKYTAADAAAAPQGNPANLRIVRYDAATQAWAVLLTTADLVNQTLTATTTQFSLFAVAGVEPAPQAVVTPTATPTATATATATAKPPVTGDFAPGSGLVLALILAGFLLITAGGLYLTQARRLRI